MTDPDILILRNLNPGYAENRPVIDAALDRLDTKIEGLRHLAAPNWRAKPTGRDATEMVAYARSLLTDGYEREEPTP